MVGSIIPSLDFPFLLVSMILLNRAPGLVHWHSHTCYVSLAPFHSSLIPLQADGRASLAFRKIATLMSRLMWWMYFASFYVGNSELFRTKKNFYPNQRPPIHRKDSIKGLGVKFNIINLYCHRKKEINF